MADRLVPAIYKFVKLSETMLKNEQGNEKWTKNRWEEYVIVLQWYGYFIVSVKRLLTLSRLYENYPEGNEELLLSLMSTLRATGDPWDLIFSDEMKLHSRLLYFSPSCIMAVFFNWSVRRIEASVQRDCLAWVNVAEGNVLLCK